MIFSSTVPAWLRRAVWLVPGAVATGVVAQRAASATRTGQQRLTELRRCDQQRRDLQALCDVRSETLQYLAEQLPALFAGKSVASSPDVSSDAVAAEVLQQCAAAIARIRDDHLGQVDAAQAAVVALGRKVQASAHRLQVEAERMLHRHPANSDVLETSMRVDHAAAQQARHAQTLAVLCGEDPGQQWPEPLALDEVVRAAKGRITAYQRVDEPAPTAVAAAAPVVEPLIHVVAELLANATQSSPPTTRVLVAVRDVQRGAAIEIDDGGIGLDDNRLQQAREIASGRQSMDLVNLGDLPQTGLPVVGAYARHHGFRVDLRESTYGGLQAIVFVPGEHLTNVHPAVRTATQHQVSAGPGTGRSDDEAPDVTTVSAGDLPALPRRQSRRGDKPRSVPSRACAPTVPQQTPEQAGQWLGEFLTAGGSTDAPGDHPAPPTTDACDTEE